MLVRVASCVFGFLASRRLIYSHMRKRGIKVIFWVANTPEEFEHAFGTLGADAVMTGAARLH